MKPKTQTVKQIMVNVSEESKERINELKEQLELTDKEFITVALQIFDAANSEDIQTIVEKFAITKQTAKIEARLAKIQGQLEKTKGELEAVGTTETSEEVQEVIESSEDVVYSAADEEEEATV